MQVDNDTPAGTIVDGIVLISSSWAHTLFNNGASHSLIPILFASMLGLEHEPLDFTLNVGVPLGQDCEFSYRCSLMCVEID